MLKKIPIKANVSDLHLCRRCPRLMLFNRADEKNNAWRVGFQGNSFCGKAFHDQIAAPFHRDAAGQGNAQNRREILDALERNTDDRTLLQKQLLSCIYRNYLSPFLDEKSQTLDNAQIDSLNRCIVKWSDFLVDFLLDNPVYRTDPNDFLEHMFLPPEKLLKSTYTDAKGTVLTVTGRFDCALLDRAAGEVVLVEFKCRKETDPTEELAQLALYAWLIRETTGLSPRTCVLYLDEKKTTANFTADQTAGIIELLPHLFGKAIHAIQTFDANGQEKSAISRADDASLCQVCHLREKCDVTFGSAQSVPSPETPAKHQLEETSFREPLSLETSEAEEYLHSLVETLDKFKCSVLPHGYVNGPRFIRLKIIPDQGKGVTFAKIQRRAEDLKIGLKLNNLPLIQSQSGHVSVDVPRKNIRPLLLSPLIRDGESTRPDSDIAVPIGAEIDGTTCWLNLADPTMSSLLVGGTSGSGKSVLLQSIVLGIRLANRDVRTEFTLIDPKRVTFTNFPLEKLDAELIFDPHPAMDRLTMLVEEMEERYHLFESEKCCDIAAYNLANPESRLTRHVTVIDEFADLMVDKTTNKKLELAVQRLGQKGRAAGFHLILATQRPEAKVISPLIKANLQVKIALKVTSQANSNIILDQPGAECLIGNGDMLLGGNVKTKRLQGPWASLSDYESI